MRLLNGGELADYIKERQAKQVRALRQADEVFPKLVILLTDDNPVIDVYVRLKKVYGEDILIDVEVINLPQAEIYSRIEQINLDSSVHGIVVQLPLKDVGETDQIVNLIDPSKDVDGLGTNAGFVSATATAIDWLLVGYNVDLSGKSIAIVGNGRLVGAPLAKLWSGAGHEISVYDDTTTDLSLQLKLADVVVSATGVPNLIKSESLKLGAVVVDAGTASEGGKIVGDVDPRVRERDDITITPEKGGVGPLTIAALFDNVIAAARSSVSKIS
jgi:methylenetetrahydrofolate dehydrogenase (NADP+)/methenyltetrahydrofolate cyclohydrolase